MALLFLAPRPLSAMSLPGGLSAADLDHIAHIVGTGAATRLLRGADHYALFPGFKFGAEIPFIPGSDINSLGDGTGSLPFLSASPRFFLAKGLPLNLDLIVNFFPTGIISSIATFGVGLKWTWSDERDNWLAVSLFGAYTHLDGYHNTLTGNDWEGDVLLSKDLVRVKPYLGVGVLFASINIVESLASSFTTTGSAATLHTFLGVELELPVDLSVQLDLFGLNPAFTTFLGFHL